MVTASVEICRRLAVTEGVVADDRRGQIEGRACMSDSDILLVSLSRDSSLL